MEGRPYLLACHDSATITAMTNKPSKPSAKKKSEDRILSVAAWAVREKVDIRQAQRWAKSGALETDPRVVELRGVSSATKKKDVKRKSLPVS